MTLRDYIQRKNGVAMGQAGSLRNNLHRSLGAPSFAHFWTYWNPIFGYSLGRFVFKPLKRFLPVAVALVLTFVCCGLIHDAVTVLFRGFTSFFFTGWFLLMGLATLASKLFRQNHANQRWLIRALANLSVIGICFLITLYMTRWLLG
ncbi:acyltransferase [Lewinella sp. IMCC34183]|uniref:acyltransferase n=1 Tax=Lewinella sp. IMCC34183 TaxID=2248762 RepID=UPI000E24D87B|nr:acyltransferase [Lewinella sp. IMCC34183]